MTAFSKTQASVHLDAIRGLAAIAVLLTHWRALLFVDYASLTHSEKLLATPLYLASQGGHLAVIIFFVLSGYLITGSVLRNTRKGTFTLLDYGSHRLIRLWMVLLPSLAIGGLLDWIGMHHGAALALYHGQVANHTTIDAFATLNIFGALRNIAFLQTIHGGGAFGSNVPLWSVAYEFWYYVLFPLGWLALRPQASARARLFFTLAFVTVCAFVGFDVLKMFPFWLAGLALHFLPCLRLGRWHRALSAATYLIFFVGSAAISHSLHSAAAAYSLDAAMTLATTLFLWVLLSATEPAEETFYKRFAKQVAGFSYTLYTIHFPALMLFTAFVLGTGRWHPTPVHLAEGAGALMTTFAVTLLLHTLFESRTPRVQHSADRITAPREPERLRAA